MNTLCTSCLFKNSLKKLEQSPVLKIISKVLFQIKNFDIIIHTFTIFQFDII